METLTALNVRTQEMKLLKENGLNVELHYYSTILVKLPLTISRPKHLFSI